MRHLTVTNADNGKKIFNYIRTVLPGMSNTEIFMFFRKKIITVNDLRVDRDYKLCEQDRITIYLKDEHFKSKGNDNSKNRDKYRGVSPKIAVIYEDDNIVVVNKSAGVLVHPDEGNYKDTLQQRVCAYLYHKKEYDPTSEGYTPSPCHRLDRNTTGVIVFAKNFLALKNITSQIRERTTEKIYVALISGVIDKPVLVSSRIDAQGQTVVVSDLKVTSENITDKKSMLDMNPDLSFTLITPVKSVNETTFVTVDLWTGRKHQIRAHLKALGHSILGDMRYASKRSGFLSEKYAVQSIMLHAYKISFVDYPPFIAPMPEDFNKLSKELYGNGLV